MTSPASGGNGTASPAIALVTSSIARKMAGYDPHRQRTGLRAFFISSWDGLGFSSSRALAVSIMAGVQNPHCGAPCRAKATCKGCGIPSVVKSSMVVMDLPSRLSIFFRQDRSGCPSMSTVQAPQVPSEQPFLAPVSPRSFLKKARRDKSRGTRTTIDSPLTVRLRSMSSIAVLRNPANPLP